MENNDFYGVIQEQGYVQGNGLGFKPLTEDERKKLEIESEQKKKDK